MLTKEEYLKLIQAAYNSENEENLEDFIDCSAWIPAEPVIKKSKPNLSGNIDVTNFKREALEKAIKKCCNITVGKFMIVATYSSSVDTYKLFVYERVFKTASELPCNMQNKVNIPKDNRFEGRPWRNKFNSKWGAKDVPTETYIDIIRWLQAITKLTVFI
jgi:cell division protein FtsI/penicillin-binding protein 2